MTPPIPPTQSMKDRQENSKNLETTVTNLIQHEKSKEALHAFENSWQTTTLAHLPLRVSFAVLQVDSVGVDFLIEQKDTELVFNIVPGINKHHPELVGITVANGKKTELIGFLSEEAISVLDKAGENRNFYEIKPLQLRGLESGHYEFDMELVRPDLRQCSACNKLHTGDEVNCTECRKKRRRKKLTLEETVEQSPVSMQLALKKIVLQPDI